MNGNLKCRSKGSVGRMQVVELRVAVASCNLQLSVTVRNLWDGVVS